MPAVSEVRIPLTGLAGACLRIALLPRATAIGVEPLLDKTDDSNLEVGVPPIQLLENFEFLYEWIGLPDLHGKIIADPEEVFQPDTADGLKGRLRTGLYTGTLAVGLRC